MAPLATSAVLLRSHDYGDSSRILRFYTQDHGLLSVVARGVRGRTGKGTSALASFASGELTAYVKAHRELHTMKDFDCRRVREGLGADVLRFAGAAACAELVLAHAQQEPHPGLFETVERALDRMDGAVAETTPGAILTGLWAIIDTFGFGPELDACVRCGQEIGADVPGRFDLAAGGMRCDRCSQDAAGPRVGPIARGQLRRFMAEDPPAELTHARQHLGLVSDFIAYHVVGRPLKSMRFLTDALPTEADAMPA